MKGGDNNDQADIGIRGESAGEHDECDFGSVRGACEYPCNFDFRYAGIRNYETCCGRSVQKRA